MAAQSRGRLQKCDWVGGGRGQVCGPQDTTPAMSSLALNVSPWNMVGLLILNRALMNTGLLVFIKWNLKKPCKGQPFSDYTFLLLPVRRTSVFHQVLHIRESYLRRITPFIFSSRMTITSTRSSVILTSARRTLFWHCINWRPAKDFGTVSMLVSAKKI